MARILMEVTERENADVAAVSTISLLQMPTWLGIHNSNMLLSLFGRANQSLR